MSKKRSKRKKVSDAVWETLERTHILEENEVDEYDEDVFFMLANSPTNLKLVIIEPTLSALHCHYKP
jgi:hypothetical protein